MQENEELTTLETQKNTDPFKKQFKDLGIQQVPLSELENKPQINHLLKMALQNYPSRTMRSYRSKMSQHKPKSTASDPELISAVKGLQLSSLGIEKNQIGAYVSYTIPVIPQAGDDPSIVQNLVIEQNPSRQAVYLLDYPLEGTTPQGMEVLAYKRFVEREERSARIGDNITICIDTYHPAQDCGCTPHHHYGESCHCPVRPSSAGYNTSCSTFFMFPRYVPGPEPIRPGFPTPPFTPLPGSHSPGAPSIGGDPANVPGRDGDDSKDKDTEPYYYHYMNKPKKEDWLRKNNYNWQMCLLTASGGCANENELVITRRVDRPRTIMMTKDVSDSLMNIVGLIGISHLSKWEQKWLMDHKEERKLIEQFLEREVEKERLQREAKRKSGVVSIDLFSPITKAGQFIMDLLKDLIGETIDRQDLEYLLSDKIITTQEFKSSKAGRVFEKLKQVSGGFKQMIQKFDGEFPVSHLRFTLGVSSKYSNANAVTSEPNNYVIEIKVNPNKLNRPDLDIARTLIHETIHAEIFRKLLSLSNRNGKIDRSIIKQMLERADFPGLLDYYTHYGKKNFQHEQMSAHYIKVIADMLQEFDNNEHSRQFYEDISWGGLMGYGEPFNHDTGLYPNSIQAWIDLGQKERLRILKVRRDFLQSYKR